MSSRTIIDEFYAHRPPYSSPDAWQILFRAVIPLMDARAGAAFLDIGCYDGQKTNAIARLNGASLAIGVDFEGTALLRAQRNEIQTVAVDLNLDARLPFIDASFDCIHAGEVIEHLFSPALLLSEIARLLKPDGYAVITTPNLASWRNRLALLLG